MTRVELEAVVAPLATKVDVVAVRAEVSELKATLTWRTALVRLMP